AFSLCGGSAGGACGTEGSGVTAFVLWISSNRCDFAVSSLLSELTCDSCFPSFLDWTTQMIVRNTATPARIAISFFIVVSDLTLHVDIKHRPPKVTRVCSCFPPPFPASTLRDNGPEKRTRRRGVCV